ncbi:MAG: hypothetical protein M1837_007063 [Sclerophora amabilis]|nr:MAG: hypothetical protein M1837_007063 [Sclerophora amabilis]
MASGKTQNPPEGLKRLSASVYLQDSQSRAGVDDIQDGPTTASPSTILLCTWMDASPRYISKYVSGYAKLFPAARIILARSETADFLYRTKAIQRDLLAPALEVLQADAEGRVLVHLCSNGGAHQACTLATLFRETTRTILPVHAMILDSSPGRATYASAVAAFSQSLPKQWYLRFLIRILVHLIVAMTSILAEVFRTQDVVDRLRGNLNDPSLMEPTASRCYIYSESDMMVSWRDVEEHSLIAEHRGWRVAREKVDGSAHVGHLRADERKYWSIVETTWRSGRSGT